MDGLNNRQESALARIWNAQDLLPEDFTNWDITDDLVVLRECGMIDMQTDMSHTLAFVRRLLPEGRNHYQEIRRKRRSFVSLGDSADELIGLLVADCDRSCSNAPLKYYEGRMGDYQALSRTGLLKVMWGDNGPYNAQITDKGWEYVEGDFPTEVLMKIENNPTFNNVVFGSDASSTSSATAETKCNITLGMTIQVIVDMDIEDELKEEAETALKELDAAAKTKDKVSFAEKLEKAASIAKSASALAGVMLPFFEVALQHLLG